MADILIIDDDRDLPAVLALLLEAEGHVVRTAADGQEGLARMDERLPDLVILDLEMPNLDGVGTATRMLVDDAGRERIPVILASGILDLPRWVRRVGAPYSIAKPYLLEDLMALVARALREKRGLERQVGS